MGVWIEIEQARENILDILVTPFMGVWIEILDSHNPSNSAMRHTLYGCVD